MNYDMLLFLLNSYLCRLVAVLLFNTAKARDVVGCMYVWHTELSQQQVSECSSVLCLAVTLTLMLCACELKPQMLWTDKLGLVSVYNTIIHLQINKFYFYSREP